jgi:hypothetical protein
MKKTLYSILSVENTIQRHFDDVKVVNAGRKLQLALLTLAMATVKPVRVRKPRIVDGLTQNEIGLLGYTVGAMINNRIKVIKAVRERGIKEHVSFGLIDAKRVVDAYCDKHFGTTYTNSNIMDNPHTPGTQKYFNWGEYRKAYAR